MVSASEDIVTLLRNHWGMERKGALYTHKSIDYSKRDQLDDFVLPPYEYMDELIAGHQ